MNKLFKHTKKFMLLATTVVMMLATTLVVLGAVPSSESAAKYSALTILKVGTHTYDAKKEQYKYDSYGNKTIGTAKPVIYTNGYTAAEEDWMGNQPQFEVDLTNTQEFAEMVELDNFIKLEVSARVGYDTDNNGKVDAYTNGLYKVKSSDESVATVTQGTETRYDNNGKEYESQYIIITAGEKTGTATIKLTESNPANPKKPKTATVKVTVKKLVDDIGFDSDVVKADANGELYAEVGLKGKLTLGTTPSVDASKKTVKYVLDATAKKYISVSGKGELKGNKSTADLEGGYVTVRVVAQDMQYSYYNAKGKLTKTTWGVNETIKVYVDNPIVKSAKILNVDFAKADTESKYLAGKAAQAYTAIPLVTNASSDAHTFKLQVAAYTGAKWDGEEKTNAVRFTTSNAKVATVDKNGVITAKANGSATITVVPVDGVALAGKEALKVTVKVTTDVEKIETANTNIETFAGKRYTIKANVNAGVSNAKAKGLKYEIVTATPKAALAEGEVYTYKQGKKTIETTDYKTYVEGVTGQSNENAGKILSNVEGKVVVRIFLKDETLANAHPEIEKMVTINFIDPIKTITATVPVYQDIYKDKANNVLFETTPVKQAAKTTLYVDRSYDVVEDKAVVKKTVDDTCVISTTVSKQFTGATNLDKVEATSSNTNVVKVLGKVDGGFEVQAVGKGTAKVTVAATDGSKVKKVVTIVVEQKVNEINVTNAVDGEIYLAPDKNGTTKTTFKAVANADANNKGLTYRFTPDINLMRSAGTIYGKLLNKTNSISLNKDDNAILFPEGGNEEPVLLGKLTVTAKDARYFKLYYAPEVRHDAFYTEIEVYAVKTAKYVDAALLAEKVDAMVAEVADGEEGITLYKGDKLDLAAALKIPATITDRTMTWSVGTSNKDTDKNYISVSGKGVLTAKKATVIGDNVTVNVTMNALGEDGKVVKISEAIEVRVIPSQADFNSELNTQITTLLKENNYTWLGAKPKFDAKKATLTLTISDITMSKEAANAEMREKLTSAMKVIKDATDVVKKVTATKYEGVSVYDEVAGKTWTLQFAGDDVAIFENDVEIGRYAGLTEADAAIDKLMSLITADIDDIVEWANRKLVVTLNAYSTAVIPGTERAEQYNTKYYTTQYTVAVTVSEKDVEAFIDNKVAEAVEAFAVKNAGKEASTGIESITYNADKNTTLVDIYNGSTAVAEVLPIVKADAVDSLTDIFMNAVSAKIEVVDTNAKRSYVEYNRGENSDVENLITELYAKLTEKLGENATMKDLEGIAVYATVDFDFAGTVYTKSYEVSFQRTAASVDAEVDGRINAFINGLEENPYGTIEYSDADNMAIVTVKDYDATLESAATDVVGKVETFVNTLTGDAYAASATINGVAVGVVKDEEGNVLPEIGKISATNILEVVKADWYKPEAGSVLTRELSELVGTTAVVEVTYDKGQVLNYTVVFSVDKAQAEAKLDTVIAEFVATNNAAEFAENMLLFDAAFDAEANTSTIRVNEARVKDDIINLKGTGIYAMLETVLAEAHAYCGTEVTVTSGKATVTEAITGEIDNEFVSNLMKQLKVEEIGHLTKAPYEITIKFADNKTITYVVTFVADGVNSTARNPIQMWMPENFKQNIAAGKLVHFAAPVGNMVMTVTGKDAYVICDGARYDAVNGVVSVIIPRTTTPREPAYFAIGNAGTKAVEYKVEFSYRVGDMNNPEVIENLNLDNDYPIFLDGVVEEGNSTGYFYTYEVEETGTVQLFFYDKTENVLADIRAEVKTLIPATGEAVVISKQISLSEDDEEVADGVLPVAVTKGDELTISVATLDWSYPELEYSLAVAFQYPEGHEKNPIDLGMFNVPGEKTVTVPAGKTVYYKSVSIEGNDLTIENAANCVVIQNGVEYKPDENGVISLTLPYSMMRMGVSFGIVNNGEEEATYTLSFNYPLGSAENPCQIILSGEGTAEFTVPAYTTVYYKSDRVRGRKMVLTNAANSSVEFDGVTYEPNEDNTISVAFPEVPSFMDQNVIIGICNDNDKEVTYTATFVIPVGTSSNPESITELGDYKVELEDGNEGYYYSWTATNTGTLTFDISATTGGWSYVIENANQNAYGERHDSDVVPAVSSESVWAVAGDVVKIMVSTYNPENMFANPAGTIKFALSFAEAGAEEIADKAVDKAITLNIWSVDTSGTIKSVSYDKAANKGAISFNKADAANDIASLSNLWDVLESVLTESKTQGATTTTVDVYCGEEKENAESKTIDCTAEITKGTIASVVGGLGIKTVGNLDGKTIKLVVNYGEFTLVYNVDFTAVEVEVAE